MSDKDDLIQYAKDLGKKLAFLIASLNVDNKIKEAFLEIAKDMDLSQIERLTQVLEDKYLDQETSFVEENLIKDLESLQKDAEKKKTEINKKYIERLKI